MPNATIPPAAAGVSRRGLLARAGLMGAAAAAGAGLLDAGLDRRGGRADAANNPRLTFGPNSTEKKFVVTDRDIVTFALNTEYFEAEFYLRAISGTGLPTDVVSGVGGYGANLNKTVDAGAVTSYASGTANVTTGNVNSVPWVNDYVRQFAAELAQDEFEHVTTLRTALGKYAPARPAVDLSGSFTTVMRAAGVIDASTIFDPFASERNFLLAAYFINDIGVTAYVGASPYVANPATLAVAAGILGVESYHAGETRTLVFAMGQSDPTLLQQANNIAVLRNTTSSLAGGAAVTDATITGADGVANITPTDANSIAFGRTFPQLLSLFYANNKATTTPPAGGFIPDGLNARIR